LWAFRVKTVSGAWKREGCGSVVKRARETGLTYQKTRKMGGEGQGGGTERESWGCRPCIRQKKAANQEKKMERKRIISVSPLKGGKKISLKKRCNEWDGEPSSHSIGERKGNKK